MSDHGTRSRYCNQGCRCEPCTAANAVYSMQRRLWYKTAPPVREAVPVERPKACCRCGIVQAPERFRPRRTGAKKRNGLPYRQSACKSCLLAYQATYRQKPGAKARAAERQRLRYQSSEAVRVAKRARTQAYRARLRAAKVGEGEAA